MKYIVIILYLESKTIANTVCYCATVMILKIYSVISGYPKKRKLFIKYS